ncbi:MAG TPA: ABC transporter permease [Longimicrobiales bacterium]|nr:ABC transporter permease [Longimicrobiales bacterium]
METLLNDLRYAARRLSRARGFTFVAVLTLALGIGANSAIFSVVNGVLLRPLPYPGADRLVRLYQLEPARHNRMPLSGPNFVDYRAQTRSFQEVAAFSVDGFALTGDGEPVQADGVRVSAGFFEVMGVRPALGRTFRAEENEPGRTSEVVLSNGLWQERFGGDPAILGRTVRLDGEAYTVVGVMPAGFDYPTHRQLWVPLVYDKAFTSPDARGGFWLDAVGRLRPGVTPEAASQELALLAARIGKEQPGLWSDFGATAISVQEAAVGDLRTPLLILLAAVGLVLLIACANVANLLLARGAVAAGEVAVRSALGAGRGRIVRQLMTESVLLGLVGGVAGLLLGAWGLPLLLKLQPRGIELDGVHVDRTVAAFTFGVALLTGLLFGALPAFQATRGDLTASLKEGGRGGMASRRSARARSLLVVAEVALAVMLLAGAGLLLRSFGNLLSVDPGFRPQQTLSFSLALPEADYPSDEKVRLLYESLVERLAAAPGVQAAAGSSTLPMAGRIQRTGLLVPGETEQSGVRRVVDVNVVTPDYFRAMGIPLRRGRAFQATDRAGAPRAVLLNEVAARRYFAGQDPIGRTISLGIRRSESGPLEGGTIVGIVGDTRSRVDEEALPTVYMPFAQAPYRGLNVVMRTTTEPMSLAGIVRREVRALDPNLPVTELQTVQQLISRSISRPRFFTVLLGIFAAVALALSAVGIFGVISYGVVQRRREIGIRMALGARPANVLALVLGGAARLALGGVVVGLVAAAALTRLMASLLFGVSTRDPMTFAAVAAVLTGVALLASYLPARAAVRVDPQQALRAE